MITDKQAMREKFEAWARGATFELRRAGDGYAYPATMGAWIAFKQFAALEASEAAREPGDFVLVPRELTEEMMDASEGAAWATKDQLGPNADFDRFMHQFVQAQWRAALKAAPKPAAPSSAEQPGNVSHVNLSDPRGAPMHDASDIIADRPGAPEADERARFEAAAQGVDNDVHRYWFREGWLARAQSSAAPVGAKPSVPDPLESVIAEMREEADELRQSDHGAGIFADNYTADLLNGWAHRLDIAGAQIELGVVSDAMVEAACVAYWYGPENWQIQSEAIRSTERARMCLALNAGALSAQPSADHVPQHVDSLKTTASAAPSVSADEPDAVIFLDRDGCCAARVLSSLPVGTKLYAAPSVAPVSATPFGYVDPAAKYSAAAFAFEPHGDKAVPVYLAPVSARDGEAVTFALMQGTKRLSVYNSRHEACAEAETYPENSAVTVVPLYTAPPADARDGGNYNEGSVTVPVKDLRDLLDGNLAAANEALGFAGFSIDAIEDRGGAESDDDNDRIAYHLFYTLHSAERLRALLPGVADRAMGGESHG